MWPQDFSPTLSDDMIPQHALSFVFKTRTTRTKQVACGSSTDQSLSPLVFVKRAKTLGILTVITIQDVVDRYNTILRAIAPPAIALAGPSHKPYNHA